MLVHHSYEALALAFKMDAADAANLIRLHDEPKLLLTAGARVPYIEPVRLEAARIVCEWVETYGPKSEWQIEEEDVAAWVDPPEEIDS